MQNWYSIALKQAHNYGIVDERDLLSCARSAGLPQGDGQVTICVNHDHLTVCRTCYNEPPDLATVVCTIPLKEMKKYHCIPLPVGGSMRFTYGGHEYRFTGLRNTPQLAEAICEKAERE